MKLRKCGRPSVFLLLQLLLLLSSIPAYTEDITVDEALKRTRALICDMNNDNKINCIDYSLLFRKIYGRDALLVVNTRMNHMLIKIGYTYVEPQGRGKTWHPTAMWGDRYDSSYNCEVTAAWDHFIKWENKVQWN
jgi:hypothetical protein